MSQCDGCAKFRAISNVVPYGEAFVAEELWECDDGYNNDDECPPEAFVPAEPHYSRGVRRFTEEQLAEGDYLGDIERDGR